MKQQPLAVVTCLCVTGMWTNTHSERNTDTLHWCSHMTVLDNTYKSKLNMLITFTWLIDYYN